MKGEPRAAPRSPPHLRPSTKADSLPFPEGDPGVGGAVREQPRQSPVGAGRCWSILGSPLEEGRGGAARLSRLTLDHRRFFPIPTAWEPCSLGLGLGGLAGQSWAQRSCVSLVTMELPLPLPHHLLSPPCTLTSQHLLPPNTIPGLGKCAVSSPGLPCFSEREAEFLAPPPATRSQAGWEAARSALQGPASRAFLAVRLGRFAACLPCGDSFIEISFAYHVIHLLKRTSQCFLAYSRSWATSPQSSSRKDTQCPLRPLPVLPSSTSDHHQPTVCPYRSACLDTWHEWNRVLCGFFVTGFFL